MTDLSTELTAIVGARHVLERPTELLVYQSDALPGYHKRPRLAVLVTGHGSPEDVALSRAAGFDAHLVKPIDFRQLERTLRGPSIMEPTSSGP